MGVEAHIYFNGKSYSTYKLDSLLWVLDTFEFKFYKYALRWIAYQYYTSSGCYGRLGLTSCSLEKDL